MAIPIERKNGHRPPISQSEEIILAQMRDRAKELMESNSGDDGRGASPDYLEAREAYRWTRNRLAGCIDDGLMFSLAQRYAQPGHAGLSIEDLAREGCVGLLRAAETYDPHEGSFPPYAGKKMEWAIVDAVRKRSAEELGVSTETIKKTFHLIRSIEDDSAQRLGRLPTQEEVASAVIASRPVERTGKEYSVAHTCRSEVRAYYDAGPVSLSWSHSEREGADDGFRDTPRTVGDFIEGSILPPERTVIIAEECGELDRAIRKLPERLQRILMAKFWEGRKNAEIAGDEDISESRVTQLLHQAYCTLRPLLKNHAYAQASGF